MKFVSKIHGEINYEEKNKVTFKKGIPGFLDLKEYIIVDLEENPIFKLLHSLEDEEIGLVLISPFEVEKDYEIKLSDEVIKNLNIEAPSDVLVLCTVTLHSKVENITVNLKGPIIINIKTGLGEQIIIDNENYKTKSPLIRE